MGSECIGFLLERTIVEGSTEPWQNWIERWIIHKDASVHEPMPQFMRNREALPPRTVSDIDEQLGISEIAESGDAR